ncbi:MAG: hypothetical protein CSA97_05510 [Bacteroidetes bacterium]|nr:MAG: hypothetical protein CSA97_05510 [Bacteroidota bacterium]
MQRLPVGIQTFDKIRRQGLAYVDKTDLIWKLAHSVDYGFLSRPRRFGKSLMLSTLASYFRHEEELFKGLHLERLQRESGEEWLEYPVIHLYITAGEEKDGADFYTKLSLQFDQVDEQYGVDTSKYASGARMSALIIALRRKFNRNVVVLVDEYDAPLLATMGQPELAEEHEKAKRALRAIYGNFKEYDELLHFVMLTGVSQFSQLSLFSGLNSIVNISLQDEWATLCGITEGEMLETFAPYLEALRAKLGFTQEELLRVLRYKYDGYRFTPNGEHVYCPYGLLLALKSKMLDNYWAKTGTPQVLDYLLPYYEINAQELEEGVLLDIAEIDSIEAMEGSPIPMLYQTGYLTIKEALGGEALLVAFPNGEVRVALARLMQWHFLKGNRLTIFKTLRTMKDMLNAGDLEGFMGHLAPLIAGVPYIAEAKDSPAREANFRNAMYVILTILEEAVYIERPSALGRSDCEIDTQSGVYIFELKLKSSGESKRDALRQIAKKRYGDKFLNIGKPIICVGATFDAEAKADWEAMPYAEVLKLIEE